MVPLVLLVHPDPTWSTFSVKFQKVWIRMDRSGPGGPQGPQPPLVDQERSGPPWTTLRHFPDVGDLDERVQGLAYEIQDTRQEVANGKQLDGERLIAFEGVIITVENATQTRQEEITRLALELDNTRKQQQEAN